MYTLTNTTNIKRDSDGAMIPADPKNRDFQEYIAWVAGGGIPTLAPLIPADGSTNYKALIRRRAESLAASGSYYDSLILLKTIGE